MRSLEEQQRVGHGQQHPPPRAVRAVGGQRTLRGGQGGEPLAGVLEQLGGLQPGRVDGVHVVAGGTDVLAEQVVVARPLELADVGADPSDEGVRPGQPPARTVRLQRRDRLAEQLQRAVGLLLVPGDDGLGHPSLGGPALIADGRGAAGGEPGELDGPLPVDVAQVPRLEVERVDLGPGERAADGRVRVLVPHGDLLCAQLRSG
ncbi:hypothetical protein GCM10025862_29860 [Arsenicicoccus piscis]|uniref:Uncharacterized protein n=1 Tax=Arsenicicoccus piscis TaxID=673954 RepID=A0ABQ6HR77_9MICO|nr:hypothetical protein GCM10025862_29860 [Arsenicicoccus piscis]